MELSAWQRTNEGMKSIASQRNAAQSSRKRYQEKSYTPNNIKKTRVLRKVTKQSAEIEALRKELNVVMKEKGKDQNLTAQVAALLNTSKINKVSL